MEEHDPLPIDDEEDPEPSSLTPYRQDGWTPFARKLFLQVLSETGRVKLACEYCRLTKQSAYALRHRDPLFAAGWDAACELARTPLADALYEKAMDGYEETVTRNGEVVATRHRFDSRLSIAVLNRLDKRCDRAEETGARHLPLLARWNEWLDMVGKGEDEQARTMLESAPTKSALHGQLGQLPLGEFPTGLESESNNEEPREPLGSFWQDEHGAWWTDYPPPQGYDGQEQGSWGHPRYHRACTGEESELLDLAEASDLQADRAEAEAARKSYFAELRAELGVKE